MSGGKALPLHAQLPWLGFAGESVVLTKGGGLLAGARLTGAPFECRSAADVDFAALRWTRALKTLQPGWRIRWQARKRRLADLPRRKPDDPLAARAQKARVDHLLGKGLFTVELSVYWWWDPGLSPVSAPGSSRSRLRGLAERASLWLSRERTRRVLSSQLEAACERFEGAVSSFRRLVSDVTPLEPLAGEDLYRDLAFAVNSRRAAEGGRTLSPHGLDRQLALSDLEAYRDHLLVDDERVECYALVDPPGTTRANLFGGILDLDAELDLAVEWQREDGARSARRIRSARRHYHQKRYSMLAHASAGDAAPQAAGALQDKAAEAEADVLGEALRELEVDGLPFGEHSLTVALRGPDASVLEAARPELLRVASAADARLHRETYNGLNAWFSMAPGGHDRQLRRNYLSAAVAADLAPLWTVPEGDVRDRHFWRQVTTSSATLNASGWLYARCQASLPGGRSNGLRGLLRCEFRQDRILAVNLPDDPSESLAPGQVPGRVVLLGRSQAPVPQQRGHVLHQDAVEQEGHRERVAQAVRVEALDAGVVRNFAQPLAPVLRHGDGLAAPGPEVVLPARLPHGVERRGHLGGQRHGHQLPGLGPAQDEVPVVLDSVAAERRGVPDPEAGVAQQQDQRLLPRLALRRLEERPHLAGLQRVGGPRVVLGRTHVLHGRLPDPPLAECVGKERLQLAEPQRLRAVGPVPPLAPAAHCRAIQVLEGRDPERSRIRLQVAEQGAVALLRALAQVARLQVAQVGPARVPDRHAALSRSAGRSAGIS
ncbi:MAG: hypothetical protein OXN97_11730 [Bryobacterales bacterium]|nr:hypothetical protein [Bryobacterales bacterium]